MLPILNMKEFLSILILISYTSFVDSLSKSPSAPASASSSSTNSRPHFPIVTVTFDHVSNVFGICLWILLGILAKIGIIDIFLIFIRKKRTSKRIYISFLI